ncbi:MAG TPA: hypothetical protein VLZ83_01525 [Edaphocola sp.]|nr:hypothetical protein [Edaphocola sp.]
MKRKIHLLAAVFFTALSTFAQGNGIGGITRYSGDMHPVIPVIPTHWLNYQFGKVIFFFFFCFAAHRFGNRRERFSNPRSRGFANRVLRH